MNILRIKIFLCRALAKVINIEAYLTLSFSSPSSDASPAAWWQRAASPHRPPEHTPRSQPAVVMGWAWSLEATIGRVGHQPPPCLVKGCILLSGSVS